MADDDAAALLFEDGLRRYLHDKLSGDAAADDPVAALFLHGEERPEHLVEQLAEAFRRYRGARVDTYPDEAATCAILRDRVAAFRRFFDAAPCQEPETAAIVAALEAIVAALPSAGVPRVSALLRLMRLDVPEVCRTKSGFAAYQKVGKWRAAAQGRASQETAKRLNDEAKLAYDSCRDAHAAVRGAAAGCLMGLLGTEVAKIAEAFQQAKRSSALLDFDDLLHQARGLLLRSPEVCTALAQRFRHVLVDEFQDTDPLQAEILWRLCGDPPAGAPDAPWITWRLRDGALFMVGDPKQAIYRFRRADVQTYLRARDALQAARPADVLRISRNFRSVAPILEWVNARFAAPLSAAGQPGFTGLFSDLAAPDGRDSVLALDVAPEDDADAEAIRAAEATAVARLCARLIGAWKVRGADGALRPCRAGDIALLAPTGTGLWHYERALEERAIPVATQAGKGFFRRQEVQDLIALAATLADGRDTLALGALLRGPLVGLTEAALLDALAQLPPREDNGSARLNLWMPVGEGHDPLLREVMGVLQGLAQRARSVTPYVLLSQAVEEMRVRPLLRQRGGRSAERALANADAFLAMSRAYETRGLRAFARAMRAQWEEATRAPEARPDAGEQAVTLITMHSAKGLEWPVVIPVNTAGQPMATQLPVLDRERLVLHARLLGGTPPGCAEALEAERAQAALERQRLWYVAATRARDLLLLPRLSRGVSDKSWVKAVDLRLDTLAAFDPDRLPPARLPSVDEASNTQDRAVFASEADLIASGALRLRRILPSRAEANDTPGPAEVLSPSDLPDAPPPMPVQGGRGRGLVLHKLMEELLTGETAAAALERRASDLMATCESDAAGCDPAELAATVRRTLALPDIAALWPRLVPELPVHAAIEDAEGDQIVSGVADAVALAADGTISAVVDWKSDVAPKPETIAGYERQVRTYLQATGAASGLIVFMTTGTVVRVRAGT